MHFFVCPAGFYCPEGTGFDLRGCPEGTYGPDPGYWTVSQCRQCDGGHYCSSRNGTAVSGPCQEGYYCTHGNASPQPLSQAAGKQTSLSRMHFWARGNVVKYGFFSQDWIVRDRWGVAVVFHQLCYFGMVDKWQLFSVSPGEGGPCPAGHYCPEATVHPLPCPRGTFSNLTKLVSQVALTTKSCSRVSLTTAESEISHWAEWHRGWI